MRASHSIPRNRYAALAAKVYEADKPVGRSFGDVEFYRELLRRFRCRRVFEPACGNGRVLVPLAAAGCEMAGSDPSPEMLERCRDALALRGLSAELAIGGFDRTLPGRSLDAVIVPAGSLQLIAESEELLGFFQRAAAGLRPGGHLLFDLDGRQAEPPTAVRIREWKVPRAVILRLEESLLNHDSERSMTTFLHHYTETAHDGLISSHQELFRLRFWHRCEVERLIKAAGLCLDRVYGNHQDSGSTDPPVLTYHARNHADADE